MTLSPFLRWVGGKRWLSPMLSSALHECSFNRYFEPFLGSGSVFFATSVEDAFLSDINVDLIDAYRAIARSWREVDEELRRLDLGSVAYYRIRDSKPSTEAGRAARFVYLNRTCFGGVFRTNKKGEFNVPFGGGRTPSLVLRERFLQDVARKLQVATFDVCDFERSIDRCGDGDFVYCDPVYVGSEATLGFSRYDASGFSWADQTRLSLAVKRALGRGATIVVSNWASKDIQSLYFPYRPLLLSRRSNLSLAREKVVEGLYVISKSPKFRKKISDFVGPILL